MDVRSVCMEEMRAASFAYYENLTDHQKRLVFNIYQALDSDGNGNVSLKECWDYLSAEGYTSHLPPDLFEMLDVNRNGILDFHECITLLYMIETLRLVKCDGTCRKYLWGTYFLCVQCYETGNSTFDLCCSCYRNKSFTHEHSIFLDNYALLRKKWLGASTPPPTTATRIQGQNQNFNYAHANSFSSFGTQEITGSAVDFSTDTGVKIRLAMQALNIALNLVTLASTGTAGYNCNIM